jgi:drug/metabolite transporter (DMT)-like permease
LAAYIGELAALGAATVWVFSSLFFTISGKRVGAFVVNRMRLLFAVVLVGAMHWLLLGQPFPTGAEPYRYVWLALSAIIGLVIGDTLLFQSYIMVGARIGVLLFVLGPPFGALLSWAFLHESMSPVELAGMALVLGGVLWVVSERSAPARAAPLCEHSSPGVPPPAGARRNYALGLLFGALAQFCQAGNLVLAKQGLVGGFPSLSGVMIRMSVGMGVMWVLALAAGEAGRTLRTLRADGKAAAAVFAGAFSGPFLGVWLSMTAVQASRVGIASTLMALTPVLSLPVVHYVLKERISPRALLGTLLAMAGVAVMVLL